MPLEPVSALSIIASAISIAASIKQIMSDSRVDFTQALRIFGKKATPKQNALLQDAKFRDSISGLLVISPKLLKQLEEEAKACEDSYIKDRRKSKTNLDKEKAELRATQCICNTLRAIMRHNDGNLPSDEFAGYWKSYNCEL
ncbi:hypothetical protein AB6B38_07500 [Glycocaulis abyssi]